MRIKECFDKNWRYYIGEVGPIAKTCKKSCVMAGLTNCMDGERGEPFAGAENSMKALLQVLPKADNASDNVDLSAMLMGDAFASQSLEEWKDTDLPHDFRLELGFEGTVDWEQGHIPNGICYYRKTFTLSKADEGRRIVLEFDGVMRAASFWYNGCFLGDHYSGYSGFQFDVTELSKYGADEGDNVLLIRCDTTTGDEGWWYEGGGIYRHVWLTKYDSFHVDRWGVYVRPEVKGTDADVWVEVTVYNETDRVRSFTVSTLLLDPNGKTVGTVEATGTAAPFSKTTAVGSVIVKNPQLWDCENPNLYSAKTELMADSHCVDDYETIFGIRTVEYGQEGLLLNGKPTPLYGACVHQDFAGVGVALPDAVHDYKIGRLKDMGVNAYRSSHNPATIELLDACDRMGMLVLDENRIIEVTRHRLEDLEELIKRGRNHPSVFAWSLSNEEMFSGSFQAKRILARLLPLAKSLDDTRPYVSAEVFIPVEEAGEYGETLYDVFGINYAESLFGVERFKKIHAAYPNMNLMNTENASWFTTRGIYEDNKLRGHCSSFGTRYVMMGGEGGPMAGGTAKPSETWNFYKKYPATGGFFIWTGFDYRGEPTPLREYQVSSNFGVMDTCGFPKDDFYYYKARFTSAPMIHIMPHWTWSDPGTVKAVRLYTNCTETELFLNGESLGRKPNNGDWVEYQIPYQSGRLEAVGYCEGTQVACDRKDTAGAPAQLILTPNRKALTADGKDVAFVTVSVCDERGVVVPNAENYVTIEVSNAGRLLGLGNGDPGSREDDKCGARRAFSGLLMALVQSGGSSGKITVTAHAAGLISGSVILDTQ